MDLRPSNPSKFIDGSGRYGLANKNIVTALEGQSPLCFVGFPAVGKVPIVDNQSPLEPYTYLS